MRAIKCKLCRRKLDLGIHAAIRYHPECKRIKIREWKRETWHRHKERYTNG